MILDAGVLISVDRNDTAAKNFTGFVARRSIVTRTTDAIVAQVMRTPQQVKLRRFLNSAVAEVHPLDDGAAVGHLLVQSATSDVVDAHLVLLAARRREPVLTGDVDDITHLRDANAFSFEVLAWP